MTIDTRKSTSPAEPRTIALGTSFMTFHITGERTGGVYSVLEYDMAPGAGAPLHTHRNEIESFYVLEGTITFQLGDTKVLAVGGSDTPCVTIPIGLRHAFVNNEQERARALVILTPAGLENFFIESADLAARYPGGPPAGEVQALLDKYNLEF